MGRFIVIILDSFGVGETNDVKYIRKQDIGSNTALHIIQKKPTVQLPVFEKLGLMNAIGQEYMAHHFSSVANWGFSNLAHFGADSFLGHQEIMGILPKIPLIQAFSNKIAIVEEHLISLGYQVTRAGSPNKPQILIVNNAVTIGDNLETDPGQVYNVTGCLDMISFDALKQIGQHVREIVEVSRVITFGGKDVALTNLLSAMKIKGNIAGVDAPDSGVYHNGYQVVHLGYGIDSSLQIPSILDKANIDVLLFGKVADIVATKSPYVFSGADSDWLFNILLDKVKGIQNGFFCLNIQETDIAGHMEDVDHYANILELCDRHTGQLIEELNAEDILIITADHGNDPTIGHSNHTRERTPVLAYRRGIFSRQIGERNTLADIGATAAEYFDVPSPEYGKSFLGCIT